MSLHQFLHQLSLVLCRRTELEEKNKPCKPQPDRLAEVRRAYCMGFGYISNVKEDVAGVGGEGGEPSVEFAVVCVLVGEGVEGVKAGGRGLLVAEMLEDVAKFKYCSAEGLGLEGQMQALVGRRL